MSQFQARFDENAWPCPRIALAFANRHPEKQRIERGIIPEAEGR